MLAARQTYTSAAAPCLKQTVYRCNNVLPCRRSSNSRCSSGRRSLQVSAVFSSSTSNPAFTFGKVDSALAESRRGGQPMTMDGTVNKAGLLLGCSILTAAYTWMQIFSGNGAAAMAALNVAKISGMVGMAAAVTSMFKPQWSQYTAPVYALCKGVALAGMSAVLEMMYPGIAMNAVLLTFSTAASLFVALKTRIITITDRFADTVRAVTGGYFVAIMLVFLGSLVGLRLPGLFSGGPLSICVHMVAAGLAAANLLLDFDMIERMSYQRLPKWMEWYGAQSLMLTLVWMYTEVLQLLWMFAGGRRDD